MQDGPATHLWMKIEGSLGCGAYLCGLGRAESKSLPRAQPGGSLWSHTCRGPSTPRQDNYPAKRKHALPPGRNCAEDDTVVMGVFNGLSCRTSRQPARSKVSRRFSRMRAGVHEQRSWISATWRNETNRPTLVTGGLRPDGLRRSLIAICNPEPASQTAAVSVWSPNGWCLSVFAELVLRLFPGAAQPA